MSNGAIEAPPLTAIGPYALGRRAGEHIFFSGQIPLDPATGKLVEGGVEAQTEQVLRNIATLLAAAGLSNANVIKTTVFMTDMSEFASMNSVYAKHFSEPYPARSTIGVAALPLGARVEIEVIAFTNV